MNINCIASQKTYHAAVRQFTEFIRKVESGCVENTGLPATWYRGQRDKNWDLLPGILRKPVIDAIEREKKKFSYSRRELEYVLEKESNLLINFKREGASFTDRLLVNKEWYYLAQHHGLPTRLLDWTKNPRIALWFAIQPDENGKDSTDGCLYTINPKDFNTYKSPSILEQDYTLNEIREFERSYIEWIFGFRKSMIPDMDSDVSKKILELNNSENEEDQQALEQACAKIKEDFKNVNGKILAISPDWYNSRQACQASFFTIHLPDLNVANSVVTSTSKIIVRDEDKLIIPKKHKRFLRTFLSIEGMRRWNVFPDFDGLAKGLIDEIIGIDADEIISKN